MGIRFGRAAVAGALILAGGCAGVPIESGRTQVVELVQARADSATSKSVAASAPTVNAVQTRLPAEGEQRVHDWLDEPLQVSTAVQIALLRNPELQQQFARLGISAADVFDVSRLSNPGLALAVLLPQGSATGNKWCAGATLGFRDLLLRHARTGMAKSAYRRTEELVAAAILNLGIEVQQAWFDCVGATQRAAVRQTIDEAAQSTVELARRYQHAGNVDQLTLQLHAAAASEARIASQRARGESAEARGRLQSLMGLSAAETQWTVPQTLPEPLATETSTTNLQSLAMTKRLDLAAARTQVSVLEQQLAATRHYRYLGASTVGVAGEREADGTRRIGPSLSLALPLFNQGQGAVARAIAELSAAHAAQRQIELQIGNDVQRQSDRMQLAREQAASFREGLIPQREAVVARLQEQVNFMLTDTFNLLLAKQQEYTAYEGYIEAVRSYWSARVDLMHAVGARLPDNEPSETPPQEAQP